MDRPQLLLAAALLVAPAWGQDDFRREGDDRAQKDALEGRPAPALAVDSWQNTEPLDLAALRGKVVVLDFWGTW